MSVSFRAIVPLGVAACLVMFTANAGERQWYTLSVDGDRIGYAYREQRVDKGERVDALVTRITITQLRTRSQIEARTEVFRSENGVPLRVRVESNAAVDRNGWRGTLSPDGQQIDVAIDGVAGAWTYPAAAALTLPDRLPEALAPLWHGMETSANFTYLLPTAAKPVPVHAERISETQPGDAGLIPIRLTTPGDEPASAEIIWLDAQGTLRKRQQQLYGGVFTWEPCERQCDAAVVHPFDFMGRLVVASPFRIPTSARHGTIRYIISRSDGLPALLPGTGEQAVVLDGARAIITVCTTCGVMGAITEEERLRYLQANAWVQSDYAGVKSFARRYSGAGSVEQIMSQLVDGVRQHMTGSVDYLGYASAREVLRTRAGDCTESAVLLAAAARARGIPARIVSGFVYTDRFSGKKDVFSPHTWVQAWTGTRWVSYDSGLGEFDSTHIALSVGTGDPRERGTPSVPLNPWRIERAGLVRTK